MYKQQDTSVPRKDHADYRDVSLVLYCEILFPLTDMAHLNISINNIKCYMQTNKF